MATPAWQVSGQYYETCSCDYVCPCVPQGLAVKPTKGSCTFAMAFSIERGKYGAVSLDGLSFIVLGYTPEEMGKGNWSVGLVADEKASAEQRDAMTAIASGAAGGPMAALSGLIGKFLGVQSSPIRFDRSGLKWSVKASDFVDMAAEGAKGINPDTPSRCISTTRDTPPRIASRSRTPRRAACAPSGSRGKTRAAGTTGSTRRLPGAVTRSSSASPCQIRSSARQPFSNPR